MNQAGTDILDLANKAIRSVEWYGDPLQEAEKLADIANRVTLEQYRLDKLKKALADNLEIIRLFRLKLLDEAETIGIEINWDDEPYLP